MPDLKERLERIALWFDVRARHYLAEAKAATSTGADRHVYLDVSSDNAARAKTIREAISVVSSSPLDSKED